MKKVVLLTPSELTKGTRPIQDQIMRTWLLLVVAFTSVCGRPGSPRDAGQGGVRKGVSDVLLLPESGGRR